MLTVAGNLAVFDVNIRDIVRQQPIATRMVDAEPAESDVRGATHVHCEELLRDEGALSPMLKRDGWVEVERLRGLVEKDCDKSAKLRSSF